MKHKKKSKDSKNQKVEDSNSNSNSKRIKVKGKPENYFKLCQQQGGADFTDMEAEESNNAKSDGKSVMNYKKIVAMKAMERERLNCSREEQLLGEKELPGVVRCLASVYDFQKCCMLDKPKEPTAKPLVVTAAQPEMPKLREVPVVPPELEPMKQPYQNARGSSQSITLSEYNRRNQEQQRLKSIGMPRSEQTPKIHPMTRYYSVGAHPRPPLQTNSNPNPNPSPMHGENLRIIVVPSEFVSLVTLHNVQMLLQERRFIPPSLMRRKDARRLEEVILNRSYRGEQQQFRVIDNVSTLSKSNWANVVAVFVLSPNTQFIGWPFRGDPVAICRHVCAFHIHFRGHPIYRELEELNINMLRLPEVERNMDNEIIMDFWRKLDLFMSKNDNQLGLQSGIK